MPTTDFSTEQSREDSGFQQPIIIDKNKMDPRKEEIFPLSQGFLVVPKAEEPVESSSFPHAEGTASSLNGNLPKVVLAIPRQFRPPSKFIVLHRWEGSVLEVSNGECRAIIRDLTRTKAPDEEISFSIDEISESDRQLAVPGSIFYWAIGYEDSPQGQRFRKSAIRFQRLPAWTETDIEKSRLEAQSLGDRLGWK
jgi:hypothetical protein